MPQPQNSCSSKCATSHTRHPSSGRYATTAQNRSCSSCGTQETSQWRYSETSELICHKCYMKKYYAKRKREAQCPTLYTRSCSSCGTKKASQWRCDENSELICNKCYMKRYHARKKLDGKGVREGGDGGSGHRNKIARISISNLTQWYRALSAECTILWVSYDTTHPRSFEK